MPRFVCACATRPALFSASRCERAKSAKYAAYLDAGATPPSDRSVARSASVSSANEKRSSVTVFARRASAYASAELGTNAHGPKTRGRGTLCRAPRVSASAGSSASSTGSYLETRGVVVFNLSPASNTEPVETETRSGSSSHLYVLFLIASFASRRVENFDLISAAAAARRKDTTRAASSMAATRLSSACASAASCSSARLRSRGVRASSSVLRATMSFRSEGRDGRDARLNSCG